TVVVDQAAGEVADHAALVLAGVEVRRVGGRWLGRGGLGWRWRWLGWRWRWLGRGRRAWISSRRPVGGRRGDDSTDALGVVGRGRLARLGSDRRGLVVLLGRLFLLGVVLFGFGLGLGRLVALVAGGESQGQHTARDGQRDAVHRARLTGFHATEWLSRLQALMTLARRAALPSLT